MIEGKYARLKAKSFPLADAAYKKLKEEMPILPALRFSNGDLWLDNFIVRDGKLAGVIDFQNAAFSDPLFEFLLSFFVSPELQGTLLPTHRRGPCCSTLVSRAGVFRRSALAFGDW